MGLPEQASPEVSLEFCRRWYGCKERGDSILRESLSPDVCKALSETLDRDQTVQVIINGITLRAKCTTDCLGLCGSYPVVGVHVDTSEARTKFSSVEDLGKKIAEIIGSAGVPKDPVASDETSDEEFDKWLRESFLESQREHKRRFGLPDDLDA